MRIQHRDIERRHIDISVCQSDKDRFVDCRVRLEHVIWRLPRRACIVARNSQRGKRNVQLTHPRDERWLAGEGARNVRVIGSYSKAWIVPANENLATWKAEGLVTLVRDSWTAAVAGDVNIHTTVLIRNVTVGWVTRAIANLAFPEGGIIR